MQDSNLQPAPTPAPTPAPRPPQQDIDDFIFSLDQPSAASKPLIRGRRRPRAPSAPRAALDLTGGALEPLYSGFLFLYNNMVSVETESKGTICIWHPLNTMNIR